MRTVGCVGDSLTRNGYPVHLRKLLDEAAAEGGPSEPGWQVSDFACDGATATLCEDAYYLRSNFREALSYGADVYVMLFGTNDAKFSIWHEKNFIKDYLTIIGHLLLGCARDAPPAVLLVVPPPLASEGGLGVQRSVVNELLPKLVQRVAEQVKLEVVDAFSQLGGASPSFPSKFHREDGCHLSAHGDKVLAGLVRDSLLRLAASPGNSDAVVKAFKEVQLRHNLGSGAPHLGNGRVRLMDEVEGKTVAALLTYAGESLRLVGYCNKWKFRDAAYCFARVPPGELCTGTEGAAEYADSVLVTPAQGVWRYQLTVLLQDGCLSFQAIGCEQLFSLRIFPVDVGEDGFFRLASGSPSSVRAAIGGEDDGHGCNFFIEEAPGTSVTIYIELLDSAAAMLLKSGRSEASGAGGTLHAAAVWYVLERRRERLMQPVRVLQEPGRQAPKQVNHARKFDSYYRQLIVSSGGRTAGVKELRRQLRGETPWTASR